MEYQNLVFIFVTKAIRSLDHKQFSSPQGGFFAITKISLNFYFDFFAIGYLKNFFLAVLILLLTKDFSLN